MEKKTFIVTGGNSGLGFQCAMNIAKTDMNFTVVLACRNQQKAEAAVSKMKQETKNPNIVSLTLDLASIASVRQFCTDFLNGQFPPLYGIVCNAGFNRQPLEYTKDGFEATFGACHLGHYLLTNLLLAHMQDDGRIVFVSSDMHQPPKIVCPHTPAFDSANALAYPGQNGIVSKKEMTLRYPMAKLCNILCVYEMVDRLKSETNKRITVNAFNPGLMTDTEFLPGTTNKIVYHTVRFSATLLAKAVKQLGSSVTSGKALAALVTDKKFEGVTRGYFDREKEQPIKTSGPSYDKEAASRLWIESAELVHLTQEEALLSIK